MSDGSLLEIPRIIRTYNVTRPYSITRRFYSASSIILTAIPFTTNPDISPAACLGFIVLILTTVIGNTLVLAAIFLDKRLHSPSFILIANMAIADLLLGLFVLPFSSVLEVLNDHWIFGQTFCSAWLAIDVLCCTASIIGLMAVSIDRYIGVTRPLNYSCIMTIRRTIYLIIIVWAVSILTSVVPLFGLTDQGKKSKDIQYTCKINKNTFYTIISSMISFYIPVIILLILYSRVYQEAKKQGNKLENEKRRLYEIDYQIASEHARQHQNDTNEHSKKNSIPSNQSDNHKHEVSSTLLNHENILDEECNLDHKNKNNNDDDTSHSDSSNTPKKKNFARRLFGKRLYSTIKRNSILQTTLHPLHFHNQMPPNDELLIIKRKLHNLKREKKAFRTVGLILGALLICWLPFFVTLPLISILKHHGKIKDENTENTWFKITFWLGYFNSALNPFVYAFSNRAIRRAFREVIFRRFCCFCCICRKQPNNQNQNRRRKRINSDSLTTETSQIISKRKNSFSTDVCRTIPKTENDLDVSSKTPTTSGPVVSFADFLAETGDNNDKQLNSEFISISTNKNPTST